MKKAFVFKHYWDEKDASTKLSPSWLTHSDKRLVLWQRKMKKIAVELTEPLKYMELSQDCQSERIRSVGSYFMTHRCKKKEDPDPTNDRWVTDITFCIAKRKKDIKECSWEIEEIYHKSKQDRFVPYLIYILLIMAALLFLYYLDVSDEKKKVPTVSNVDSIGQIHRQKMIHKHEGLRSKYFCNKYFGKILHKDELGYCFESYINDRCIGQIGDSYSKWLKSNETPKNAACSFVKALESDLDFIDFVRKYDRKERVEIKKIYEWRVR